MTDQAQSASNHDLVSLYAGRVKARYRRPDYAGKQRRAMRGVHTFGRRPAVRQLSSRPRRAMTALVATAMLAGSTPVVASGSANSHEIQPGETLTSIATTHGTTVDDLVRINDIEDPDTIYAGDLLNIAQTIGEQFDVEVGDTVYRVKDGDTLFKIARDHGVSLSDLLNMNDIENQDLIYAGDTLIIPTRDQFEPSDLEDGLFDESDDPVQELERDDEDEVAGLHLVARGETLSSIALRYDVTVEQLAAFNDIENYDQVQMGMMLRIPVQSFSLESAIDDIDFQATSESNASVLDGLPVIEQSLPLGTEAAALSMVTAYWDYQVSDWVFIENMPYHPNPHHGFRGEMNQQYGGTDNYGVYPGPLAAMLANYGFVGDEFYTQGDTGELRQRIDQGQPVLVWTAAPGSESQPFQETYDGETFTLVEGQHVVVVYGYDENGVYIADPAAAEQRTLDWDTFVEAWAKLDGMSMAVYPKQ